MLNGNFEALINWVVIIPIGWLWHRLNRAEKRQQELGDQLSDIKADTAYLRGKFDEHNK